MEKASFHQVSKPKKWRRPSNVCVRNDGTKAVTYGLTKLERVDKINKGTEFKGEVLLELQGQTTFRRDRTPPSKEGVVSIIESPYLSYVVFLAN